MRKKNMIVTLLLVLGIVSITIGVTYAFFNYTRTGTENVLALGRIYFNSTQGTSINLTNVFPVKSTELENNDNVGSVTLTVTGDTTYDDGIEYLISADNVVNTVNSKQVPIGVVVTTNNLGTADDSYFDNRGNSTSLYKVLASDTINGNDKLVVGYITKGATGINGTITIKAFIDADKIAISDTYDGNEDDNHGTTTSWVNDRVVLTTEEWNSLNSSGISFKLKVEANEGLWVEEPLTGEQMVRRAITAKINAEENACNPIWVDDMDTPENESDDITYFSGTNDCVDMNYVWYSGKLWRITAIYPDGAMKLVTEDALTAISWGSTIEYDGSWIYQWLNEDFYDTLVNPGDILISDSTWNYSTDVNSTPVRPESIATQKTKQAPIGLLNAYEYYNAYRNASTSTNYLNIGYVWWLITPYSTSGVRHVNGSGSLGSFAPASYSRSVRPSVNLKSGLEFTGSGTKSNPYIIAGDKDSPSSGTLISSRSIGEYVKFDGDNYRIVSIDEENGTTKLTRVDYLRDNGTVIEKKFASSAYFGKSTNTQEDTYWDYYLNNTWYNNINTTYKNMLVDGTYYLGLYSNSTNYKATICKDTASTLDSITTKNCTKYTSSDTNKIFTGKVGLARVGEMFSSQLGSGYSSSSVIWTITPYDDSHVHNVGNGGYVGINAPASTSWVVRPSINLKSGIKITGGTGYVGGETSSPFEISE